MNKFKQTVWANENEKQNKLNRTTSASHDNQEGEEGDCLNN